MAEKKILFTLSFYKAVFTEIISPNTLQTHVCINTYCGQAFSFLSITVSMTVWDTGVYFPLI